MISKTITGILQRFAGDKFEFNNINICRIGVDVVSLVASDGYTLVYTECKNTDLPPFEPIMIHKDDLKNVTDDFNISIFGDDIYLMCNDGNVVACAKQPGAYANVANAMKQIAADKPTKQEIDGKFMKKITDSAVKLSDDFHISPGNDKEPFILTAGSCTFAVMPRG